MKGLCKVEDLRDRNEYSKGTGPIVGREFTSFSGETKFWSSPK